MQNFKGKDFEGKDFEGNWNEKIYKSKIVNRNDLFRIYVNNEEIHINEETLINNFSDKKLKDYSDRKIILEKLEDVRNLISELRKIYIEKEDFTRAINDFENILNYYVEEYAKDRIIMDVQDGINRIETLKKNFEIAAKENDKGEFKRYNLVQNFLRALCF